MGGRGTRPDKKSESETIALVLSELFSPITQEDLDAYLSWGSGTQTPGWIEESFQDLMTQKCYDRALETGLFMIPVKAFQTHTDLELKDIKTTPHDNYYSFTGALTLKKKGQESQTLSLTGSAQVDKEAKISSVTISNMDEISQAMP